VISKSTEESFGAIKEKSRRGRLARRAACIKAEGSKTKPNCLSGLERSDIKKDHLPGQAEGRITSMDTTKQQA
jgi:hypothetical protein